MQIQVGIISVSDRATQGVYEDAGGPALREAAAGYGWEVLAEDVVPDEISDIQRALRKQVNKVRRVPQLTVLWRVEEKKIAERVGHLAEPLHRPPEPLPHIKQSFQLAELIECRKKTF